MNPLSRRDWLISAGTYGLFLASGISRPDLVSAEEQTNVINIGSRRELFIDDYLVDLYGKSIQPTRKFPSMSPSVWPIPVTG